MNEFKDDCIHLKACRRLSKVLGKGKSRGCNDYCTAYENKEELFNYEQVNKAMQLVEEYGYYNMSKETVIHNIKR